MKEQELREIGPCCICGRLVGELPYPVFHQVKLERHILDLGAVTLQQGLAMQLNGNGLLAQVMGPNEEMTQTVGESTAMICDECMCSKVPFGVFMTYNEDESQGVKHDG